MEVTNTLRQKSDQWCVDLKAVYRVIKGGGEEQVEDNIRY